MNMIHLDEKESLYLRINKMEMINAELMKIK